MKYHKHFPIDDYTDIDKLIRNSDANLEHLKVIDKMQAEKGEGLLYRYFSMVVGDGYAYYQVTEVTTRTATVTLCEGISLDNYCDRLLGYEATLPRNMVQELIDQRISMEKLFAH